METVEWCHVPSAQKRSLPRRGRKYDEPTARWQGFCSGRFQKRELPKRRPRHLLNLSDSQHARRLQNGNSVDCGLRAGQKTAQRYQLDITVCGSVGRE